MSRVLQADSQTAQGLVLCALCKYIMICLTCQVCHSVWWVHSMQSCVFSIQNPPHPVVLAKVRGYPLWPAKVSYAFIVIILYLLSECVGIHSTLFSPYIRTVDQ